MNELILQNSLEELQIPSPIVKLINTLDDLDKYLCQTTQIAIDTETDGFHGDVRLVQLYDGEKFSLIDFGNYSTCEFTVHEFTKILLEKYNHIEWIGANIKYEFRVLDWVPAKWHDVLSLGSIAFYQKRWRKITLDMLAKVIDKNAYENIDKKVMQKAGFSMGQELTNDQYLYALLDAYYTYKIFMHPLMQKNLDLTSYKLDNALIPYVMQIEKNGLIPNQMSISKAIAEMELKIMDYEDIVGDVNVDSYKQVRRALNSDKSDEEALLRITLEQSERSELADAILNLRKFKKALTMLKAYADTDENGKVYTSFDIKGTVTGRMSASGKLLDHGINSQQIPRKYKHIFIHNTEQFVSVNIDYSTAELRMGAAVMNEPIMAEELTKKLDIHKITASALNDNIPLEQVTKEQRQFAKGVNFGLLFAMGAEKFQKVMFTDYGQTITLEQAKEYRNFYLGKYKSIARYAKYWWNNYKTEPVISPLGRKKMANLGTDAVNYGTQSGISETIKLAINRIGKYKPQYLPYIFNIVHDSINLRIPTTKPIIDIVEDTTRETLKAWNDIQASELLKIKGIPMASEYELTDLDGNKIVKELWSDIDL